MLPAMSPTGNLCFIILIPNSVWPEKNIRYLFRIWTLVMVE